MDSCLLDSSASNHITGNPYLMSNISKSKLLPMVALANGRQTLDPAGECCQTLLVFSVPLESVLYAPNSPFNLVFVRKITRSLNSITFYVDLVV